MQFCLRTMVLWSPLPLLLTLVLEEVAVAAEEDVGVAMMEGLRPVTVTWRLPVVDRENRACSTLKRSSCASGNSRLQCTRGRDRGVVVVGVVWVVQVVGAEVAVGVWLWSQRMKTG